MHNLNNMEITNLIGPAKVIATLIEKKFPGTCGDIISDLDKAQHSPTRIHQSINNLKDLWNKYKDSFSEQEIQEISSSSSFNLSDPSTWKNFNYFLPADDVSNTADAFADTATETATEVAGTIADTTDGIVDSILGFIADVFS